ncbi:Subtilase family protein [Singulisphaera sp. GP187]|uniref:S8 family serine peptidase n=1 Tax=Singulisphaera sp. GP187 TaxID=1882752 RepID=UPI0009280ECC|nr:S8 family serine peptidase [Singulisphaera sp. GP187]SIO62070.1 Subtilase family protein [Singulisphaera sp. GP187]
MGSFKANKRNQGPDRRRGSVGQRFQDLLRFEHLEERTMLDASTPVGPIAWHSSSSNVSDVKNGPMANAGADLIKVFQSFQSAGGNGGQVAAAFPGILISGNSVGVDIKGTGSFSNFVTTLQNVGMQVTATDATRSIVEGLLPISALLTVSTSTQTVGLGPIYRPHMSTQGVANNEADATLKANTARQQYGVNGTGVTVGVLSDSVSKLGNGLAGSVATGDLPNNVNVIQDGNAGATDEGRAMLENIYDIAPGASLAFATADNGQLGFAGNIRKLANQANAKVIVDDVGYLNEPMFQDGVISQAVIDVTQNNGVSYFSAAGNSASKGYLSQFRGVTATPGALPTGRYMNFNPNGGTAVLLPVTTSSSIAAGSGIGFQFDQPWYTTNGVTSDVDIFLLDSTGAVISSGNTNNIATQTPDEFLSLAAAQPNTTYYVAIRVNTGADPGFVQFIDWGDALSSVSQQFGSGGSTYYPTTFGHPTSASAIGVGAIPWWGTNPTNSPAPNPVRSEPFSSYGPALIKFNSLGNPLVSPQLRQKPDISAPDGGNTSFFGGVINTSNPPFPGQPSTPTNLSQNLPSFFGTSSAAPNAAAVAALMKQKVPTATPTDIRNALVASASPLNGQTAGTWNVQGGFGLVDAVKAVSLVGGLQVLSSTPGNSQTVNVAPTQIIVTFNSAVQFSSVSASNLVFTSLPPGVSAAAIGTPIPLDNATNPTMVAFPITINSPIGVVANGNYSYKVQGGIVSTTGQALVASNPISFTLNDTVAPVVANTFVNGRVITIQFSEAVRPSTINPTNIQLIRAGSDGSFGKPSNVNLSNDPRLKITYNPANFTATLDYSALDQSQFPSDQYALVILAGDGGGPGVTDVAGNFLDGEFNGVFPSGNGVVTGNDRFTQFFGFRGLTAPLVTSFQLMDASDTGIKGDGITNANQPVFIGQVGASFPGTVAGLQVLVQFNGLHNGQFDLAPGGGGRGFVGTFDVLATTDANGTFIINAPFLPEGYNSVRVLVIGQPDSPPLPGLSSSFSSAFRIDRTGPTVIAASLTPTSNPIPLAGSNLANLSTLSLHVLDNPIPTSGPLATPQQILVSALDPATAGNISNYSLINLDTGFDASSFIASAVFVATGLDFISAPSRTSSADPFAGRIDMTFNAGLPAGRYAFVAHTAGTSGGKNYSGLKDAAGNALNNTNATGSIDFQLQFTVQNQATFLTNFQAIDANSNVVGGPRSYYELPALNQTPRANAPPSGFILDFANPLKIDPNKNYNNAFQLIASANTFGGVSDGDFGTFGVGGLGSTGTGFSVVPGTTVSFFDKVTGAAYQPGVNNADRAVVKIAAGTTLPADHYRLYVPNSGATTGLFDIYGNQFDGEFLGTPTSTGGYEDLLPNGQYRTGLTGDGVGGGAFVTGFVVVPNGNIIYARPDATENPLDPTTAPDGSLAKPYAALAPEVDPGAIPANPTHDPNKGANDPSNFFNFNSNFDRNGDGHFTRSALYAAEQLSYRGPVVVVALPATPTLDPVTGQIIQQTFVLQAPAGPSTTINDGSASVPFNTSLVFNAGSALKLQNASLYVQNQGSSLQLLGGANPNDRVNITSWADATVGGKTNGAFGKSTPAAGDWGGIIFRSIDTASNNRNLQFPIDISLKGVNGGKAISGADDTLSFINFANVRYAGGAVPQTQGQPTSAISLYNSRPTLANSTVAFTGVSGTIGSGGSNLVASISADFDSFREDDIARGPLIRRTITSQNSLNGILVRADSSGVAQQTDAILYPDNPASLGGTRNYVFDDPLPIILVSQLLVGQQLLQDTGGQTSFVGSRLYIQPGMLVKSQRGAGIAVVNYEASMNIGSRTYINQYDADHNVSPNSPGFKANSADDAKVLFTSLYDNVASTSYFDPSTQQTTIIVPAIDSGNSNGANQPSPNNVPTLARWGSVSYQSGAVGVVNRAEFRYGGGLVNGPGVSVPNQSVLAFITSDTPLNIRGGLTAGGKLVSELGTHVMVTNNDFFDNLDTAMQIEPNGLMAGDAIRPLLSGHPYFRGNVMQRNDIDGLAVVTSNVFQVVTDPNQPIRRIERTFGSGGTNLTVNSVWDSTDLTYVLRGSVVLAGDYDRFSLNNTAPLPDPTKFVEERKPHITLTVQSALPDTLLADGTKIGRPGETALVKLMSDYQPWSAGLSQYGSVGVAAGNSSASNVGAGFMVGVDDGVDPPTAFAGGVVDPGAGSQIRFVGIPGNESTGQQRVPVVLTSLRDGTVGTTVRGVNMFNIYNRDVLNPTRDLKAPAKGDGGNIYFGGNSLTDYNLYDPRDGNLIDNADIRYLTRIEIQGGGIIDVANATEGNFATQKLGLSPLTQFNSSQAMTISNSNLAYFSEAAVFAHANSANAIIRDVSSLAGPNPSPFIFPIRDTVTTQRSQGVTLFMYGNTISNSAVGVEAHSDALAPQRSNNPTTVVLLNNTFYNNPIGLHTIGYGPGDTGPNNHVYWLAMNNIFSNSTTSAILSEGYAYGSQAQYNLFWQNTSNLSNSAVGFIGNTGAIIGDPAFRDPANLNFQLGPNSAAIDASRSEIGPLSAGDAIFPTVTQVTVQGPNGIAPTSVSIRTDPNSLTFPATPGRSNPSGGNAFIQDPRKLVLLPGRSFQSRKFFDQWVPVLTTDANGVSGPASNGSTYNYAPAGGVLDALGFQRLDDPNVPDTGFGSNTSLDIGAFEYRVFNPPKVVAVTATTNSPSGVVSSNFYKVGGAAGSNSAPLTINIQLNHNLDPSTVTNKSVLLQASGGDGIFGNGNSVDDTFIDLSGKLSFNPTTSVLTIHLADAGVVLKDDAYRVFLLGSGANVLRDPQGAALDGENTAKDDPNGAQLPLPSGDGFPSGNFFLNFTVNTESAQVLPGSFVLATPSDTNVRDYITYNNLPSFTGAITVAKPAINPIQGQTVVLDISTKGDGVFDRMNAGTALTDALGTFVVTVGVDAAGTGLVTNTKALADSSYTVGPDGILRSSANLFLNANLSQDDTSYSIARIRVVNSGNTSDPSYTGFVVDTTGPKVTSFSPNVGSLLQPDPSTGKVTFSFTTDKNINPASLNVNTLLVTAAGPDQVFGTPDDISVPIDYSTIGITPLKTGGKGAERITFTLSGALANDLYRVTLKGTGSGPITDIAGNPLGGSTGIGGADLTYNYVVFNPTASHSIFVGAGNYVTNPGATPGSRENPFATITLGMAAAVQGDVVAVLPGIYTENVTLKSLVRLVSANTTSTNTALFDGNPLTTIIRAPAAGRVTGATNTTVTAVGLFSVPGLNTEISGFTIASPLLGDPALGALDISSVGLRIQNSNMVVTRNYFVDSGFGIAVETSGAFAVTPYILRNGFIGNATGLLLNDIGGTSALPAGGQATLLNNTFAFNTFGVLANVTASSPIMAQLYNNIFWQNHDQTLGRNGAGIYATVSNKLIARNNLFSGNGADSATQARFSGFNVGNGFNKDAIGLAPTTDSLGNYAGDPAFVSPRDPRPGADGPAAFFIDANFNLTFSSAAIDGGNDAVAPLKDFLGRSLVKIPGKGFPNAGPKSDIGAFEFQGTGGIPVGGAFRIVTTSVAPGGAVQANGMTVSQGPGTITVAFSGPVDRSSVTPNDLVISGSGLNNIYPAKAASLTWIDEQTVRFNLTGGYKFSGDVNLSIPQGAVKSLNGAPSLGFADSFKVNTPQLQASSVTTPVQTQTTNQVVTPAPAPAPTPAPAPAPTKAQKRLAARLFARRFHR